jgi:hypothetical protein
MIQRLCSTDILYNLIKLKLIFIYLLFSIKINLAILLFAHFISGYR